MVHKFIFFVEKINCLGEIILYDRDAAGHLAEVITQEDKSLYPFEKSGRLMGIFSPGGTSQRI
ncbi:hypothetical protein HMPREF1598_00057 [Escherichia coli 907710]|nr:hypothetical protein HMPREF1590_00173 [Escherichia coli 113302]ESD29112.1 hypothetical protein HMPREF1598_00057 [Escherichia coli 907710]